MEIETQLKTLNNATRLKNLEWLKYPADHFPPQEKWICYKREEAIANSSIN
jgi:hypothetical protein